jgi:hypothetical protein
MSSSSPGSDAAPSPGVDPIPTAWLKQASPGKDVEPYRTHSGSRPSDVLCGLAYPSGEMADRAHPCPMPSQRKAVVGALDCPRSIATSIGRRMPASNPTNHPRIVLVLDPADAPPRRASRRAAHRDPCLGPCCDRAGCRHHIRGLRASIAFLASSSRPAARVVSK